MFKRWGVQGGSIKGYGSAELSHLMAGLVVMELFRADGSLGTFYEVHTGVATSALAILGTEAQKAKYLPRAITCEDHLAFALTEPDYGSEANALQMKAEKVPGGWSLTGTKRWIGIALHSDLILVWARDTASHKI